MLRNNNKPILIVGAGIAGLALAQQLQKHAIPFTIIEKRMTLTNDGTGIALPANAVKALEYMGLGKELHQEAHQIKEIIYTNTSAQTLSQASLLEPPFDTGKFLALPRQKLHEILRQGIENKILFNTTISQLHQTPTGVNVKFSNPEFKEEEFSAVIGADGVNSYIRHLVFDSTQIEDLGVTIWRFVCKYPTKDLQPTYMLGTNSLFMAYPIGSDEVYCYAHTVDPEYSLCHATSHQKNLTNIFAEYGGIAKIMLNRLPDDKCIIPGRLQSLPKPLFSRNRVALIGDAGHACSPMLQQGAASAIEDVIALSELLIKFSILDALKHYAIFREDRIKWITQASDIPMKALIAMNENQMAMIQEKIRASGPLNVQGWKTLLKTSAIDDIQVYIEREIKNAMKKRKLKTNIFNVWTEAVEFFLQEVSSIAYPHIPHEALIEWTDKIGSKIFQNELDDFFSQMQTLFSTETIKPGLARQQLKHAFEHFHTALLKKFPLLSNYPATTESVSKLINESQAEKYDLVMAQRAFIMAKSFKEKLTAQQVIEKYNLLISSLTMSISGMSEAIICKQSRDLPRNSGSPLLYKRSSTAPKLTEENIGEKNTPGKP